MRQIRVRNARLLRCVSLPLAARSSSRDSNHWRVVKITKTGMMLLLNDNINRTINKFSAETSKYEKLFQQT